MSEAPPPKKKRRRLLGVLAIALYGSMSLGFYTGHDYGTELGWDVGAMSALLTVSERMGTEQAVMAAWFDDPDTEITAADLRAWQAERAEQGVWLERATAAAGMGALFVVLAIAYGPDIRARWAARGGGASVIGRRGRPPANEG